MDVPNITLSLIGRSSRTPRPSVCCGGSSGRSFTYTVLLYQGMIEVTPSYTMLEARGRREIRAARSVNLHPATCTLITPLVADIIGGGVLLRGEINTYKIECSGCEMALVPVTRWLAYGHGVPATAITMTNRQAMPFAGKIILTAVPK